MENEDPDGCLRAWRDRLHPGDVGLPAGGQRRAPGLRREELAQLAGLSVDSLSRLEEGRAGHPARARALRLDDAERDHLFRLAGQAPPAPGRIDRHLTPGVQRILDRLHDVPVTVLDAAWNVVAINPLALALLEDPDDESAIGRNLVQRYFTGDISRFDRTDLQRASFEAEAVADLREAAGRYPEDPTIGELVDELQRTSPRFAELWRRRTVAPRASARKTVIHPTVGRITLDCDVLRVRDSDLGLVVYTATPGSPDATALQLVAALGTQSFAAGERALD